MLNLKITGLLVCFSLVLAGCNSLPTLSTIGSKEITINSTPEGADINADGKLIGKTPMKIIPDDVFPPRWKGSSYLVSGTLGINKPGCKAFEMPVSDPVLSKDIKVDLECDPNYQPPTPVETEQSITVKASAEERLDYIDNLLKKGKITQQEYQAIRQRILNSL